MSTDIHALKARTNLLDLVGRDTHLKRVSTTDGGEYAGPCPFCGGTDRFRVKPGRGRWWCRQCSDDSRWGDAIAYVMRRDGIDFREACEHLDGPPTATRNSPAAHAAHAAIIAQVPTRQWRRQAEDGVAYCEETLWSARGQRARAWLNARGLSDQTLRYWRVGYNERDQDIAGLWVRRGITLPWVIDGEVWHIKVRRPSNSDPKYTAVKGGQPLLYGGGTLRDRRVAVLVEGEFDAMLLHQEAGDLVGVATLGSCSATLDVRAMHLLLPVPRVLVAYDRDAPGQQGAGKQLSLSRRMRAIQPPHGDDITEFWHAGGRLRDWVRFHLAQERRVADDITVASPATPDETTEPDTTALSQANIGMTSDATHRDSSVGVNANVSEHQESVALRLRQRVTEDPRPDLAEDSARWSRLLSMAYDLDGDDPAGLYGALNGLRC